MKKTLLKSALMALAGIGLMAGSASAAELTLQEILDGITVNPLGDSSVNVATDALLNDSYWSIGGTGGSYSNLVIELAGNAGLNTFGIFDTSDRTKLVTIFDGSAAAGDTSLVEFKLDGSVYLRFADTGVDFAANSFGFFLGTPNGPFFSDSFTDEGADHMKAFQGKGTDMVQIGGATPGLWLNNEWILAWEDLPDGRADWDYNDFVVMVESVTPVPEPATMLLFGTGLAGLAGIARRRKK